MISDTFKNTIWIYYETNLKARTRKEYWNVVKNFDKVVGHDPLELSHTDAVTYYEHILNLSLIHISISGYSILLIDLDPQMNTSKMFGKSEEGKDIDYEQLFCSKFDDKATVMNYISTTDYENISILCASRELNNLIYKIYDESKESNVELCFKHNLSLLKDDYDYIIIDNSPFKSYLTTCALSLIHIFFVHDLVQ